MARKYEVIFTIIIVRPVYQKPHEYHRIVCRMGMLLLLSFSSRVSRRKHVLFGFSRVFLLWIFNTRITNNKLAKTTTETNLKDDDVSGKSVSIVDCKRILIIAEIY